MSKRKKLLIGILVFLAVLAAMLAFYVLVIEKDVPEPEYQNLTRFNTEEPDWDTNILEDDEYLALDRKIYFSNGSETFELSPTDTSVPDSAHIFTDYIDGIVMGERERVNGFYTAEFIEGIEEEADKEEAKRHPFYRCVTEDFTMQRVYDITVTFVGKPVDVDTGEQYDYYILEYKISRNSGTFLDIMGENYSGHDLSVPQHVKVVERNGEYKIASIGFAIPKELE